MPIVSNSCATHIHVHNVHLAFQLHKFLIGHPTLKKVQGTQYVLCFVHTLYQWWFQVSSSYLLQNIEYRGRSLVHQAQDCLHGLAEVLQDFRQGEIEEVLTQKKVL